VKGPEKRTSSVGGFSQPSLPLEGEESAGARAERATAPLGEGPDNPLSIDELSSAIKSIVAGSFPPLWVEGEVTQFTSHRNGHWYFSLKGANASIKCVVWASTARWLPAAPDEGMKVIACGQVDVYQGRTDLQFMVSRLTASGDGLWRKAFEQIRARLEKDGLLDPARKRRLPYFPRRVAVITSPDGAALHDITSVVARRNPLVEVVLIPAAVQGEEAVLSLGRALTRLVKWGGADVVIIGRGGGSREDLWAFNDERLARKLATCPVPVITAVGHETDMTICDLVSDFRAPTPSAAAEMAVPNLAEIRTLVARLQRRLADTLASRARGSRRQLEHVARRLQLAATRTIDQRRLRLTGVTGRLEALSPLATLARGYAVATDHVGKVITTVTSVRPGDTVTVRVRDGRIATIVESAESDPPANP
jgi:exodeoxyribonuclease VII large subunit